jgi:hypothetical protein
MFTYKIIYEKYCRTLLYVYNVNYRLVYIYINLF